MTTQTLHPSRDVLSAFALGTLPEDRSAVVEDHVNECDVCSETLAGIPDDTFTELLACADEHDEWIDVRLEDVDRSHAGGAATGATDASLLELADHARYEVQRLLGRGGMGDVYLAEHRLMQRHVAIKVMKRSLMGRREAVQRFRLEVTAAAKLHHENIVTAYDAEQVGDWHLLVMEYIDGHDLASEVKFRGSLPIHTACNYARQAALGLAHAHEHGMVHRDVKPQNMIVSNDVVKILDFGLAHVASVAVDESGASGPKSPALTNLHAVLGTPDYISPEQIESARDVDHRADIYGLGATLYFMLAGQPPFAEGSVTKRIKAHRSQQPHDIRKHRPEVDEQLADLIRRMMAKSPDDRPQSAEDVAQALQHFCQATQPRSHELQRQTGGAWWYAMVPVMMLLLAAGGWGLWQIIVTIRDQQGNENRVVAPAGSEVRVQTDGNVRIELNENAAQPIDEARRKAIVELYSEMKRNRAAMLARHKKMHEAGNESYHYVLAAQASLLEVEIEELEALGEYHSPTLQLKLQSWVEVLNNLVGVVREGYLSTIVSYDAVLNAEEKLLKAKLKQRQLAPSTPTAEPVDDARRQAIIDLYAEMNQNRANLLARVQRLHELQAEGGGEHNLLAAQASLLDIEIREADELGETEVLQNKLKELVENRRRYRDAVRKLFDVGRGSTDAIVNAESELLEAELKLRRLNAMSTPTAQTGSVQPPASAAADPRTTETVDPAVDIPIRAMIRTRDGYYLGTTSRSGRNLTAESKEPSDWNFFRLDWLDAEYTRVRLIAHNGSYIHPIKGGGDNVDVNAREPRSSEIFDVEWVDRKQHKLRLRTREGHYLHAVRGGGGNVDAKVKKPGSSEVLTLVPMTREKPPAEHESSVQE